ncbi:MAG: IS1096 element passenger TnpR family protein [Isosphaeraceae bacterium]
MADYTPTQGRYLSFIQAYTNLHGYPPAESEIAAAFCVTPPSAHLMVKTLEKKGLILRHPGQPRSLEVLVPEDEIPPWNRGKSSVTPSRPKKKATRAPRPAPAPPANLYVLSVFLSGGPMSAKFANKIIYRVIEIRGDQTLEQLHQAIFEAYDRFDQHAYEFQLGKRPFDSDGPNYGTAESTLRKKSGGDARTTTLDDLNLKQQRAFGYWFDFGDDWYHQVQVERIEQAIPTVTYPRVIKRVGKSPPQYPDKSRD